MFPHALRASNDFLVLMWIIYLKEMLTRDPRGCQCIWYPGYVALPERSEEVIYLLKGDQLLSFSQLLIQLTLRREEDNPGEEEAFTQRHSVSLQMAR